ncbi:RNA polymerase sigma factor [Patulibacter defluvii]|uniref:RNA polymerase sigma factor n=1 Tax=Patulibacter defluvii TaxID=3095358 RepID=UPI002A757C9B|nr:sigma-70 family RNA polymerase sigma factor [Patulibacter sp. DM4]
MPKRDQQQARIEATFAAHYGAIAAYLRRRCPDPDDADDATARVFAVAWRRIDRLPPEPETRLWLYGVARRVLAEDRRSRARRTRLAARSAAQPAPGPADPADTVPRALQLRAAWRALSDGDRELLALAAWEGLRTAEIARVVGLPAPLVSKRLSRARRRLADRLDGPASAPSPSPSRPRPREEPDHA